MEDIKPTEKYSLPDFVVIDDDLISNDICYRVIKNKYPEANVQTFTEPETGLAYIDTSYSIQSANNAVLFLDINMPSLNGWDVLSKLKESQAFVMQHLEIYLLSSSAYFKDKQKAANIPILSGYLEKPLTLTHLQNAVGKD